jgi:two-component system phosphate regulon sensor histidine kinase PhoR
MNGYRNSNLLAAGALIISAGWTIAWLGGWLLDSGSWPVRAGLLAAGLAFAGGVAALLLQRMKAPCLTAQEYFDTICRHYRQEPAAEGTIDDVAPLPTNNPWSDTAGRVRDTLDEYQKSIRDLEHDHVAMKIRCRRAATQVDRITNILSGLPEPIIAVDDYGELLLANRSAEELFQFQADDLQTRALAQLVRCETLVDLLSGMTNRNRQGSRTDEVELRDSQDNSRWFQATASSLVGSGESEEDGSADLSPGGHSSVGAVVVLRDIGNQRAMQKRNAEFVSAVSHEMKTPLAGIKAYVELLVDGDAEDEQTQEEFLGVINSQADRLQRLIDNMLNLARIEAGVVKVSKHTRPLNEILEEALHIVQPAADAKRIELVAELSPMYLGVLADRDMLLQSAINLLSNAVKYTPEHGTVTMRSRLADNQVLFEVQDTGVGLSEEDCGRVFEKFYRVKKDKSMASGTGLGLPLAKHIVEDVHGGRLTAESTLGVGSTFSATIPGAGQMT